MFSSVGSQECAAAMRSSVDIAGCTPFILRPRRRLLDPGGVGSWLFTQNLEGPSLAISEPNFAEGSFCSVSVFQKIDKIEGDPR